MGVLSSGCTDGPTAKDSGEGGNLGIGVGDHSSGPDGGQLFDITDGVKD